MLTRGGIVGSMVAGSISLAIGGVAWSAVVVSFFASSSLLSRVASERKRRIAANKFSRPGARDLSQTMTSGGAGALAAQLHGILPTHPTWLRAAFVGAFATAAAVTDVMSRGRAEARVPISVAQVSAAAVLQHALDAASLPFDEFQSRHQRCVRRGVKAIRRYHVSLTSPIAHGRLTPPDPRGVSPRSTLE